MADGWGTESSGGWGDTADTNGFGSNDDKPKSGCFKCGEEGHRKSDCPNAGDDEPRKRGCFKCGEEGHNKADCPQAGDGDDEAREKKCFKCGGDHFARECEKPDVCRMCGEEGHMSKDCSGAKTHSITKEDGTTQEIYIPKEVADDDLFQQGISSGINFDKFDKIPVKCSGDNAPAPAASFESMGLRQLLRDNIEKSGYKKPTPIQKYAIPIIANKRDLMACAQTGSGKTAAFLLPILHNILEDECDLIREIVLKNPKRWS